MKAKIILLVILFSALLTPKLVAQSSRKPAASITLQDIYNRIDELEKKVDQKFEIVDKRLEQIDSRLEQFDKRLIEVEKTLAVYDERFQAINRIFTIFGLVFGVVILIAVTVFGYYFNKLGQLISEIEHLDARVDAKRDKFLEELIPEDIIKKFHSFLRQETAEPARIADEVAEYKTKPK
jgi:predicted PurR-regulated permease PerM